MAKSGIKVSAPATITNIAGGLTTLGMALVFPADEIIIREGSSPGLVITEIRGASKHLSYEIEKNPVGLAAQKLLTHLGENDRPIELEIHKKIPLDVGLGSSAALAAAGVYAIQEYLRAGMSKQELIPFAVEGLHADENDDVLAHLFPALLGGMILKTADSLLSYKKLYIPAGLCVAVISPETVQINKNQVQQTLQSNIKFDDSYEQAAYLAAFVASMYTSDFELMTNVLQQTVSSPILTDTIPYYEELKNLAFQTGAKGFGTAGFGPSVYALCTDSGAAKDFIEAAKSLCKTKKIGITTYFSNVNHEGAIVF